MIKNWGHRGLKELFETRKTTKVDHKNSMPGLSVDWMLSMSPKSSKICGFQASTFICSQATNQNAIRSMSMDLGVSHMSLLTGMQNLCNLRIII